jgi:hypothetical protein
MASDPILIVGDGPGRLMSTLALSRHGLTARVLDGVPDFGAVGYGFRQPTVAPAAFDVSQTHRHHDGWNAGGGVEYAFKSSLTLCSPHRSVWKSSALAARVPARASTIVDPERVLYRSPRNGVWVDRSEQDHSPASMDAWQCSAQCDRNWVISP